MPPTRPAAHTSPLHRSDQKARLSVERRAPALNDNCDRSDSSGLTASAEMPVPSSPQLHRRVVTLDVLTVSSHEEELGLGRPPTRKYSEAFSSSELTGTSSVGGFHRSRERTRQSKTVPSVLRLVERRRREGEKAREKDRDRSWAGSHHAGRSVSAERGGRERSQSGTRSENGFMLGRGSSRLRDFDGTDETSAKTYITITPGQPTRIRAQSPSKSAKLSCDETVTSARERSAQSRNEPPLKAFDLNRSASPSPQRKHSAGSARVIHNSSEKNKEFLRTSSPLRSTDILKSFQATKSQESRKLSFVSEKTIHVNQCPPTVSSSKTSQVRGERERKLSIEILKTHFTAPDDNELTKRASVDPENSSSNRSSVSSLSGSSSDSGVESDLKSPQPHISQRRISLEQRFQARARISSPERSNFSKTKEDETKTVMEELFCWRESANSRKRTSELSGTRNSSRPIPASRKISLPQTPVRRPEPAPRRRSSLHIIVSVDR